MHSFLSFTQMCLINNGVPIGILLLLEKAIAEYARHRQTASTKKRLTLIGQAVRIVNVRQSLQYAKLAAHLDEGGDALVELFAGMSGGDLNADAGLLLRHHGVVETRDVDAFVLHAGGIDL